MTIAGFVTSCVNISKRACNSAPETSFMSERMRRQRFRLHLPRRVRSLSDPIMSGQKPGFGVAAIVLSFCGGSESLRGYPDLGRRLVHRRAGPATISLHFHRNIGEEGGLKLCGND